MPEPFKNAFNKEIICGMAEHFKAQWAEFDAKGFSNKASKNLDHLELKERSEQIMNAMVKYLPKDFTKSGDIILASLSPAKDGSIFGITVDNEGIAGWAVMPMAHYVGLQGHNFFSISMILLKELTKRFSSEFGIRFFLLNMPMKTASVMKEWAKDDNRHVRRLASEGIRPRLPWATQLPLFIQNPEPIIEILEILKDDKDEYVRRSVANNLNDIAKDHPDVVIDIAGRWMKKASEERKKLIRHACRTLIKQGNKKTLHIFGYMTPILKNINVVIYTREVLFGTDLQFELLLKSDAKKEQPLMIDYIIHHQKSNGKTTPKVFKWRTKILKEEQAISFRRNHPFKKITTRKYHQGLHTLEIVINGISVGKADFQLLMLDKTHITKRIHTDSATLRP